jgi:hypothetical protein
MALSSQPSAFSQRNCTAKHAKAAKCAEVRSVLVFRSSLDHQIARDPPMFLSVSSDSFAPFAVNRLG